MSGFDKIKAIESTQPTPHKSGSSDEIRRRAMSNQDPPSQRMVKSTDVEKPLSGLATPNENLSQQRKGILKKANSAPKERKVSWGTSVDMTNSQPGSPRRIEDRNRSRTNSMLSSDNSIAASSDSQRAEGSVPREQQGIFPSGERRLATSPEPIDPQEQSSREALQTLRNEIGSSVQLQSSLQNTTDISDTTTLAEATFSRLDRLTKYNETQLNKISNFHIRSDLLETLASSYRSSAEIYTTTGVDTLRNRAAKSMEQTLTDINGHLDTIEKDLRISPSEQNP